jgi:hypothetical protein
MTTSLACEIRASLAWLLTEAHPLSTLTDRAALEFVQSLSSGIDSGQADTLWYAARSVPPWAHDDLELMALERNFLGGAVAVSLARVKALLLINDAADEPQALHVGGAGSGAAFAGFVGGDPLAVIEVPAGGCVLLVHPRQGWTVTPGTGDVLRIANGTDAEIPYRLALLGSAA